MNEPLHKPVLMDEVIAELELRPGDTVIDATFGLGGYTKQILQAIAPHGKVYGLEQDPFTLEYLEEHEEIDERVVLSRARFSDIEDLVAKEKLEKVDAVVFDLGISSWQLSGNQHGVSFQSDAPLDMRLFTKKVRKFPRKGTQVRLSRIRSLDELQREGTASYFTALELLKGLDEKVLAQIFREYGEERFASKVARAIVEARPNVPNTTLKLHDFIGKIIPRGKSKIDPATKIFQALRIAVNDELGQLEQGLEQALKVLKENGRIVVVSFHSLEDRTVKQFFRKESRECICPPEVPLCDCEHKPSLKIITKKPLTPTSQEIKLNPRARSAKLRSAHKI
ncbi:16S rRNA (cytosine(1402)-N(4))-methyltransferase RsmH [Patescibacteria group bacterium]